VKHLLLLFLSSLVSAGCSKHEFGAFPDRVYYNPVSGSVFKFKDGNVTCYVKEQAIWCMK
jgi:hypothetical protein